MLALLQTFSWQELRHHPWRDAAAIAAVMLGVALAFSVALINRSALDEFAQAVRQVDGQSDLQIHAARTTFDEAIYALVAGDPRVRAASPVLELQSQLLQGAQPPVRLRVVGVDALQIAQVAPALQPTPDAAAGRLAVFAPRAAFLNPAARRLLAATDGGATEMQIQTAVGVQTLHVAGSVHASGPPLVVLDIGAAQDLFALTGRLSRIDLRLQPGQDAPALAAQWRALPQWPAALMVGPPPDAVGSVSNLSRAYRVNLSVLALVALFTGAFLVFSVLALSVAKRAQQFALLAVLGLSARERQRLVLAESLLLGLLGSALGIVLGTLLAFGALHWLGGDLGGGYFRGVAPQLQWSVGAALGYGLLGVAAAMVGAWMPARSASRLPPAQTLKGLGPSASGQNHPWRSLSLLLAGAALALAPAVAGVPLAAYAAIALLLLGGIGALPTLIALLYERLAPLLAQRVLAMLAVERARRQGAGAAVAISGVVAALGLAVALTVMVASFRHSVQAWLDIALPADLYLRQSAAGSSERSSFTPDLVSALRALPGVRSVTPLRAISLNLAPEQPAVALLARPLSDPARALALTGAPQPPPPGMVAVYVSEPVLALYGARPGMPFERLSEALALPDAASSGPAPRFFVAGVWRDYARQFGAIAIDLADYVRLSGDRQINNLALSLTTGADPGAMQDRVRALVQQRAGMAAPEIASATELRANSLRIFDRSFAVTWWLQAVAIAIGLFGVAASFSAQVLARRKEFGLLVHLGLTRRQLLTLVAFEGLAWTAIGTLAGVLLGLCISVILVHVVNPQSFHWSMDLLVPWPALAALCGATVLAGTGTAWLAARAAAQHDVVLAVKEDW